MLNAFVLCVIMLSVVLLSIVNKIFMLDVVMPCVVRLIVVAPLFALTRIHIRSQCWKTLFPSSIYLRHDKLERWVTGGDFLPSLIFTVAANNLHYEEHRE
jgi:hypothetical protein